jgi:hypothetical protein
MTTQWEYLSLTWSAVSTEKKRPKKMADPDPDPDPDPGLRLDPEFLTVPAMLSARESYETYQVQETMISIKRPGSSNEETIVLWSSETGEQYSYLDLYNRLGAEGWEMVSVTPDAMRIFADVNGYPQTSSPVRIRYWFKRQI